MELVMLLNLLCVKLYDLYFSLSYCIYVTPLQDLGLAMAAANSCKSLTPLGSLSRQLYQLMVEQGHAEKDFSYIFKFLEKGN